MNRLDLDILPEPFVMCLGTLFTSFGKKLDRPTGLLYWRALHDVPVPLLEGATGLAVREREYASPPRPAEVRRFAERCRQQIVAARPWGSCGQCSSDGWTEDVIDGVRRAVRCPCKAKHQAMLRELGADGPPITSEPRTVVDEPEYDWKQITAGDTA